MRRIFFQTLCFSFEAINGLCHYGHKILTAEVQQKLTVRYIIAYIQWILGDEPNAKSKFENIIKQDINDKKVISTQKC